MSRLIHMLKHEHRVIEKGLRALDGMCLNLKIGNSVPPEALSELLDFIQNFADRFHHAREESFLFPALRELGFDEDSGALWFLKEEHGIERNLLAELEIAIDEYGDGDTTATYRFVECATKFRDHLLAHMQKEEGFLFRLADEVLDETDVDTLAQSMIQADLENNQEIIVKYELQAEELEKAWAI